MTLPSLNISHKFIAYLLLLSILPLLIVGGVSYQISSSILREESSHYTEEVVHHELDYIDLQLEQVESMISNLSGVDEIRDAIISGEVSSSDYSRLTTQTHIGYILNAYSNLDGLVSIDIFTVNKVHYHVGDTLNTDNIRSDIRERLFNETLNSNKLVTWLGIEDNININSAYSKVIVASKILYTFNRETLKQEPIALLLVNYSVEHLYDYLIQVNLGENASVILVDKKGRILFHPDKSLLGEQVNPELADIISSGESSQVATVDNVRMSISVAHSDVSGWTIIGLVPINTLNAKSADIQGAVIVVLILCFVGVAIIASIYNRNVVMPIREITEQLKLIQQNPSNVKQNPIAIHGHDEIAELSQWFNSTQILYHASRSLIAFDNLPNLLQNMVNDLVKTIAADRVILITVDLKTEQITRFIKAGTGAKNVVEITFDELNEGLTGWVLREGKPALSPKNISDPRESKAVQQRRIETNCGDIIVVPLMYHGEMRGTLTAIHSQDGRDFTEQDVELMMALANQAVIALENAQLVESLRISEQKFVKAFHASPEPMCIISLEDKRFIEVNESFLHETGYAREELVNHIATDMGILTNKEEQALFIKMAQEKGFVRNFETTFQHKLGKQGVWLLSSEVIDLDGESCLLTVSKDITEHKQAEQHRLNFTLERERVQILTNFIAEAAHEFKTPLSIINTNAYLLEKAIDIPKHTTRIGQIAEQVKVINELVDTLSFMTKLDSGEHSLMLTSTNMNEILRSLYHEKQSTLDEKQISCVLELSEFPLNLNCDVALLKRALGAIWTNAIQYTDHHGSIIVRSSLQENKVIIEISDTGIGISENEFSHIFERFFQSDKSGTVRGFGLGLPIAKTIIELHQGAIEVESVENEGSIFRVILPIGT